MMPVPARRKIYHITHVDNLASIASEGCLWSDAVMVQRRSGEVIGNHEIKADRLRLPVCCHPGTSVGEYVPFYFCPRSVMLYVISKRNHPNVAYSDGQGPVVHLVADLHEVVARAETEQRMWAFSDINAANRAADFYKSLNDLDKLDWNAIQATNWAACRDHKMAEFLSYERFPWGLVSDICVFSEEVGRRTIAAFGNSGHRPSVKVKRDWYY
jgi:ssDNA thymidine ADP-ribosyltransferase, DarT